MPGELKGTVLKTLCCECEAFVVNLGSDHLQLQCSSSPAPCLGSHTLPILVEKAFFICRIFIYTSAHRCVMCILHRTFRGDGGVGKGTAALPRIQCQPGVANPPRKHRFHHLFRAQPHPSWIFLLSDMLYNLVWQSFFTAFDSWLWKGILTNPGLVSQMVYSIHATISLLFSGQEWDRMLMCHGSLFWET